MINQMVLIGRRAAPLVVFAVLVLVLILSAVFSIADLVASRNALASETDLLTKLQDRAARKDGKATINPPDYVFVAASQGVATADFQRRISELLMATGADLQLSEVITADADGDVGRLAIAINFEIEETKLDALLFAIENAKPALMVERLSVRTLNTGQGTARTRLQGTATIIGAWRPAS